jgi:hypothetical protein
MITIAKNDQRLEREAFKRPRRPRRHGAKLLVIGMRSKMTIYRRSLRCLRIVEPMEQGSGGEVYHYPSHDDAQRAVRRRGPWEWHQDYGYWYFEQLFFPLLAVA